MARVPQSTDFHVTVAGVGNFVFARRKMRDELSVQAEYARLIQGTEPTNWLALVGGWIAALTVLTVSSPDGWDIDDMDPLDDETYRKLDAVHAALVAKERSFRRGPSVEGAGPGAAAS